MALLDSLAKIRRFLRDPDGDIWTDEDLMAYWNDAQVEFAQKVSILERAEAHYYPPRYDWAFMWDWEQDFLDGDKLQALILHQGSLRVISHPWESAYWLETIEAPDYGDRWTHPFEVAYCSPSEAPKVLLHQKCDKLKFMAYDLERIEPLQEREIAAEDRYYKTRSGQVTHYYRPDVYSNQIVIYPIPSNIVFQDYDPSDVFDDTGGQVDVEGDLNLSDYGLTTDVVDPEDALFMIYSFLPYDAFGWDDETEWPDWILKYIEYGTLERAFGADTDGFIPTLRDYWKMRKEIGINAIKKFKRMMTADRDYRMGGQNRPRRGRGPSLPAGYPSI